MGKLRTSIITVLLAAGLAGCGGGGYDDIDDFMARIDDLPRQRIEPLPPFEQVPPFAYQASTMRSPFEPPVVVKRVERAQGGPRVTPDFNRVKQFLEQFTIARLSMVGTLAQSGTMFGLIQDGEGGVHRVRPGDYMGTDHGQIQRIDESAIELIEIVADGTGGWVERARTVSLGGGGA
jgi:type IV pilus assembly protein PilP